MNTNNITNSILTKIEQLNINECMLDCYIEGYSEFEIFNNNLFSTVSSEEHDKIMMAVKNKVNESKYANKLRIHTGNNGVAIVILCDK